jgi:hypothetical protein
LKGKCHCGEVEYELISELKEVYCCNCKDCQVLSGSGYHLLGIVDRESINVVSGELVAYRNPTESGYKMTRNFCPTCGTPVFIESTRFQDISMLLVSTLENSEIKKPSFEIWTKSKYSWADTQCNLRGYESGACD